MTKVTKRQKFKKLKDFKQTYLSSLDESWEQPVYVLSLFLY